MKAVASILTGAIAAILVSMASPIAVPSTPHWASVASATPVPPSTPRWESLVSSRITPTTLSWAVVSEDTLCGKILTGCDERPEWEEIAHNFIEHPSEDNREHINSETGEHSGYHGDCRACQWLGQWVDPDVCHPTCPGSSEDEDVEAAYDILMAAVERGDVHGALVAAGNVPEYVMINDSRRSLQILGCEDRIIANLPLGDLYVQAKEALDESNN